MNQDVQNLIAAAQNAVGAMQNMRQGRFQGATERLRRTLKPFEQVHQTIDAKKLAIEALEAWEDEKGEGACDCMPEAQHERKLCLWCKIRSLKEQHEC